VGTPFYHPFENASIYRLVNWFYCTSQEKSLAELDSLVCDAILATDFDPEEIRTFSAAREMARLDAYGTTSAPFSANDNWKEGSVTIWAPKAKHKYVSETAAPEFKVSGVYYRPFLEVLKSACQSPEAQKYHWVPFELFHKSAKEPVRVYSEIYNSEAMLEEDAKIRALPREPGEDSDTEVAVLSILLWSDSTHLTNFGMASLWPIYVFFGNLSKYTRGKPSALAAHHLAYIPSVSNLLSNNFRVIHYATLAPRHYSRLLCKGIRHVSNRTCPTLPQSRPYAANMAPNT
jgi:hypothetical protein